MGDVVGEPLKSKDLWKLIKEDVLLRTHHKLIAEDLKRGGYTTPTGREFSASDISACARAHGIRRTVPYTKKKTVAAQEEFVLEPNSEPQVSKDVIAIAGSNLPAELRTKLLTLYLSEGRA